ncbi:unnamed protein product [Lepeophtheirus salmonis]|uniref:(salmon louse) hypothetical protein n=1 Tax=Lepeophtheirus salmonis TaxID=72036 RepID=A0A7R8CJU5_LEPSM|nr:unnamed protein product [Lepeophtheirus salmonis]CAF2844895.1 unnamed protein product [Lepeophtheirus salmonis]
MFRQIVALLMVYLLDKESLLRLTLRRLLYQVHTESSKENIESLVKYNFPFVASRYSEMFEHLTNSKEANSVFGVKLFLAKLTRARIKADDLRKLTNATSKELQNIPAKSLNQDLSFRLDKDSTKCRIVVNASLPDPKDKTKSLNKLLMPMEDFMTIRLHLHIQKFFQRLNQNELLIHEQAILKDVILIGIHYQEGILYLLQVESLTLKTSLNPFDERSPFPTLLRGKHKVLAVFGDASKVGMGVVAYPLVEPEEGKKRPSLSIRQVCSDPIITSSYKIGGPGKIVQIDESLFDVKCFLKNVKLAFNKMAGVHSSTLSSHLNEFMWRQKYGLTPDSCIENLFSHLTL